MTNCKAGFGGTWDAGKKQGGGTKEAEQAAGLYKVKVTKPHKRTKIQRYGLI